MSRLHPCFLFLFGLLLGGINSNAVAQRADTDRTTVAEQYLLAAANQDRAAQQLPPLHLDEHLALAARLHAYEMVKRRTISHQFDGERGLADRVADAGAHFSLVTENVAQAPNSAQIHDLWMHSAGHRANLLDPNVDAVGIAVLWSQGEFYAVEDFAHSVQRLTLDQQEASIGRLLLQSGLELMARPDDARQTCQLTTGYAGDRKPWFVMRFTSSELNRLPDELKAKITTGRFHLAAVGACVPERQSPFTSYSVAVLLYP